MAVLGTITIGNVLLFQVDSDPNGSISAPLGSLSLDSLSGIIYSNKDGASSWKKIAQDTDPVCRMVIGSGEVITISTSDRCNTTGVSNSGTLNVNGILKVTF